MMTIKVQKLKSVKERTQGLIGREIEPVFFKTRFGIHTFGMKKPIDVIVLDDTMRVRTFKKSLKPLRIWVWNPQYANVLELPRGFIEKLGIKKGERIIFD